ncbi:MAG: glycosyltransferase [Pseudomonadota bacterium]
MLDQALRLYRRYLVRHRTLRLAGPRDLSDGTQPPLARLDALTLEAGSVTALLQASNGRVGLAVDGRERVAQGGDGSVALTLPHGTGPIQLWAETAERRAELCLRPVSAWRLAASAAWLTPGFATAAARTIPDVMRWFRHKDVASRMAVRDRLGLGPLELGAALPADLAEALNAGATNGVARHGGASIVVPIYGGGDLLAECLDRVLNHTTPPFRLILVDDASPPPGVKETLIRIADRAPDGATVRILTNPDNLGFVGTANRGIAEARIDAPGDPVVLLNSDALVPDGWLDRLLAPLDDDVASVTPMSNDAELVSVPTICAPSTLNPGEGDEIDAIVADLPPDWGHVPAPTGVGFCMALSPRFLDAIGSFDPAFGRGYGEEVDWCQKAIQRGGRHLCLPNLFVEHRGGASFGSETKRAAIAANGEIIRGRYPRFDQDVQDFIATDPLIGPRLIHGLAFAATRAGGQDVPIYIAHDMGGGAEADMLRRIEADVARLGSAIVLRLGGVIPWQIELWTESGLARGTTSDWEAVEVLLRRLPNRKVIYNCAVGAEAADRLPDRLLSLEAKVEVLVHDYFVVSPSYTLLDSDDVFRGVPDNGHSDPAHEWRGRGGQTMSLAKWRETWGRLLGTAERIEVFSESSRAIVSAAYPALAEKIALRPHALLETPDVVRPPNAGPLVIGVLGNINAQKGGRQIASLARYLKPRGGRVVVLGRVDPALRMPRALKIHGTYDRSEIAQLARRYGINCWFIPSIWPETFSFTTHECLATGRPVMCFDLGAQADAVNRGGGATIALTDGQFSAAEIEATAKRLIERAE